MSNIKYRFFLTALVIKNILLLLLFYPPITYGQAFFKNCENPSTIANSICVAQTESCAQNGCFSSTTQCGTITAPYFQYNDFVAWGLCNQNPPAQYGDVIIETSCSKCQYYYCAKGTPFMFNINGSCWGPVGNCNYVAFKRDSCITPTLP